VGTYVCRRSGNYQPTGRRPFGQNHGTPQIQKSSEPNQRTALLVLIALLHVGLASFLLDFCFWCLLLGFHSSVTPTKKTAQKA
jgi:hypothetical protein